MEDAISDSLQSVDTLATTPKSADFKIRWIAAPERRMDANGPTSLPFEPFPAEHVERPVFERFLAVALRCPDRVAVDDGKHRLSYAEALQTCRRLAAILDTAVPRGHAVGGLLPSSVWSPIALLACLAAGRPYVPLDLHYPKERNQWIIGEAGLGGLLVDSPIGAYDPDIADRVPLINMSEVVRSPDHGRYVPEPMPVDAPAVILYTSGSTGRPKGVVNNQLAILQRVLQYTNGAHIKADDHFLPLNSPCTIVGVRESVTALLNGATLHLRDPLQTGLREIRRVMREAGITVCYSVPALLRSLIAVDDGSDPFRSVRILRVGGDKILADDVDLIRRSFSPDCHILLAYSSTETIGAHWFVPRDFRCREAVMPLGYMLPGVSFAIVGDEGASVSPGEVGELLVRSRFVALGDWENRHINSNRMCPDPFDPTQRVYATGDLVSLGSDGLLRMAGRKDRQVKIRGQRVEPAELETVLRRSALVADAAVIARRLAGDAVLVGFVVPKAAPAPELQRILMAEVRAQLPPALWPVSIHVLHALPKLPSAKVDHAQLEAIDRQQQTLDSHPDGNNAAPETDDVGDAVARSWRRLLGQRSFASGRSWLDAGGDSLGLLQFAFEVEATLGRALPLDIFDSDMCPADFIVAVEQALNAASSTAEDERPLLIMFPGVGGDEPGLAALRTQLAAHLRIIPISYPDLRLSLDPAFRLETMIQFALSQVIASSLNGAIHLVGYSFGGLLAYAVARELNSMGREIAFLGIFDSDLSGGSQHNAVSTRGTLHRLVGLQNMRRSPAFHDNLSRVAAHYLLASGGARWVQGWLLGQSCRALFPRTRFAVHYWTCRFRRQQAAKRWLDRQHDGPATFPTVLFRAQSGSGGLAGSRDLGWASRCQTLRIVDVPGSHASMLGFPNRAVLGFRLLEALTGSERVREAQQP